MLKEFGGTKRNHFQSHSYLLLGEYVASTPVGAVEGKGLVGVVGLQLLLVWLHVGRTLAGSWHQKTLFLITSSRTLFLNMFTDLA